MGCRMTLVTFVALLSGTDDLQAGNSASNTQISSEQAKCLIMKEAAVNLGTTDVFASLWPSYRLPLTASGQAPAMGKG